MYNRRMMQEVRTALSQRDLLLYVADATRRFSKEDEHALDLLRKSGTPAFLVLNKIDRVPEKRELLSTIDVYRQRFEFEEYLMVSALKDQMLDDLRKSVLNQLPEGPEYFPPDQITDQPERFLAAELIREKILRETRQEVPHSVAVFIDHWEEGEKLTRISSTVYVERQGQKGIIIGNGGATLKRIGTLARVDIENGRHQSIS